MIVRSFILIFVFCLLTSVSYAEPIKEDDPSETYVKVFFETIESRLHQFNKETGLRVD